MVFWSLEKRILLVRRAWRFSLISSYLHLLCTLDSVHDLAEKSPQDAVLPGEEVFCVVAERLGQFQPHVLVRVQPRVGLRLLHLLVVLHVGVALLSGIV